MDDRAARIHRESDGGVEGRVKSAARRVGANRGATTFHCSSVSSMPLGATGGAERHIITSGFRDCV